tara:strand:+ start:40 stop:2121 length:2082 start_codon:yes stop_codon:yes gene_type:complete
MSSEKNIEQSIMFLIKEFNDQKYDQVIEKSKKLIEQGNKFFIFYNLIGASYSFKNYHNKAIDYYLKALDLEPTNEEIYRNLGKSLIKEDRDDEAIHAFNQSLNLKSNNADCYFNLGLINLKRNEYLNAISNLQKTIELKNQFYQAYYNLGIVYNLLGNLVKAEENYNLAIKHNNKYFKAYNNLSTIYIRQKKFKEAINTLEKCLSVKSNYIQAITNLGVAYQAINNFKGALLMYEKAIKIQPDFVKAISQKLFLNRKFCYWVNEYEDKNQFNLINISTEGVTPWQLLSLDDNARDEYYRAKNYSKEFMSLEEGNSRTFNNKKIKIGYFTSDFHYHAGMMNMEGLFKYYNKNKFEIIAFDYGYNNNDETHYRIKKYFDKFFYVSGLSDKEIADLSIKNKIDIGIHRNGFSQNSRSKIFAYNPCVVQINFLGYPGTTALDFIDYIIADKIVIPENHRKFYSEKIIYMPNTYYPTYDQRKVSTKKFKRSDYNIPDNAFVLCTFNNSYKISSQEFSIWMQIMLENPSTYLLLLIKEKEARENLLSQINKYKIDKTRIVFFDYIDIKDHLARHSLADLYLDTFNYNGHTSTVDSLFSGLPVVTKIGNSFSARVCASMLKAFHMEELITESKDDYYKLITKLINDKTFYNNILVKTKKNISHSKLFNTKNYVKNLEKAFEITLKMKIEENKVENIFVEN